MMDQSLRVLHQQTLLHLGVGILPPRRDKRRVRVLGAKPVVVQRIGACIFGQKEKLVIRDRVSRLSIILIQDTILILGDSVSRPEHRTETTLFVILACLQLRSKPSPRIKSGRI
jgi:hypothetical protein